MATDGDTTEETAGAGNADSVLVPVDVSTEVAGDLSAIDLLAPGRVTVLGYWPVPDHTAPTQLRNQYETTATDRLETLLTTLTNRHVDVSKRLVFTPDRENSIDRAANEYGSAALLTPGNSTSIDKNSTEQQVLVLLKPDRNIDRILRVVSELFTANEADIVLFHASETADDGMEYMLRGAADRLRELGIARSRIDWQVETGQSRLNAILSVAPDHDLIVLGETQPSVRERVFGVVQSNLLDQTDCSVMTVRPQSRTN